MAAIILRNRQHSRITRRILRAIALFGSVEMLTMCCNVIRTKLIALWVGTAGVGLMGLFSTALDLISQVTQLSLRTVTVRFIAASSDASSRAAISRSVALYGLILAIAGALITALLAPLLSILTFGNLSYTWGFAALSLAVAASTYTSTQSAILQGNDMLRRIALASIIGVPVSLAVAIPVIYYWRIHSIIPIIVIYTAVMAAMLFLLRFRPQSAVTIDQSRRHRDWADFARLGIYLSLAGAATYGASYLLMSYINHAGGESTMGLYQAGYSLSVRYVGILFTAMAMEYYPRIAGLNSPWRISVMMSRQSAVGIAILLPCALAIMAFAPWIVRLLYSHTFLPAVHMVVFAVASLPLRVWSWAMGFVILASGKGRLYLLTEVSSAVIGLALNIAGYSLAGLTGLGISFIIWYALYSILLAWLLRCHHGVVTSTRIVAATIVCSVALTAAAAIFYWHACAY